MEEEKARIENGTKDPDVIQLRENGQIWTNIQVCDNCEEEFCHGGCALFEYELHQVKANFFVPNLKVKVKVLLF